MQLNNKNNHDVIKIDKIRIYQNIIVYSLFDIKKQRIKQGTIKTLSDLPNKLKVNTNFFELAYSELLEEFTDFELSDNIKNWKNYNKELRVIIPQDVVRQSLLENNELGKLIMREINNKEKHIYNERDFVVAYYKGIDNTDMSIIEPYVLQNLIIVETKND